MVALKKLCKKLGFDGTAFSQIQNWGTYTDEEFKDISMLSENGEPKKELLEVLKHPLLKEHLDESNIQKFIEK